MTMTGKVFPPPFRLFSLKRLKLEVDQSGLCSQLDKLQAQIHFWFPVVNDFPLRYKNSSLYLLLLRSLHTLDDRLQINSFIPVAVS